MGFSLGGLLGPALTVATQSAGTYQQGQANAQQAQTQALMQQIALKRQADQDALRAALQTAQTGEANARTNVINNPPPNANDFHYEDRPDGTYRINTITGEAQKVNGVPGVAKPTQFVPGAVPGTRVDPNNPNGVSVLPGVQLAIKTGSTPGQTSERDRINGWRTAYSANVRDLMKPQADPTNPFLKKPGLSYADAKAQAAQMASDAWGPAPLGAAVAPPITAPKGGATGNIDLRYPAQKIPATPKDSATAKIAAQRIHSGQATLEQALASPALSPAVKALLQSGYTGNE